MKDFYSILKVTKDATAQEIKISYRSLAIKYHPDKNFGSKAYEEKFKEISEAYETLSNSDKRVKYDFDYKIYTEKLYREQQFKSTTNSTYSGKKRRTYTYAQQPKPKPHSTFKTSSRFTDEEKELIQDGIIFLLEWFFRKK